MSRHKLAIIAAMKFEIDALVKGWPRCRKTYDGREFEFFERGNTVVVCGGIGAEPARRAAEAVIQLYHPDLLMSVGFAGALQKGIAVGRILTPRTVIDAADGSRTDTGEGEGILVSFDSVADASQKSKLHQAYCAQAVDMEAAAVAKAAEKHSIAFRACKAVSDAVDFSLPAGAAFVGQNGRLQIMSFALHIGLRPWLWPATLQMARNSSRAAKQLSATLAALIAAGPNVPLRLEPAVSTKS